MTENLDTLEFPSDLYRTPKTQIQEILQKLNIKYRDDDTVAELRPVVADLKAYLKTNLTQEKQSVLKKLLSKRSLTDVELLKHPNLVRVEEFIRQRDNLYDTVADDGEENYEEINLPLVDTKLITDTENQSNTNQVNINFPVHNYINDPKPIQRMTQVKEKLPFISAGTYHGLPSENPSDFIDKYEIAATSNHWAEKSKINLFAAHLAGTALAWYQHFSTGKTLDSWEELKNTFILTFTPAAQAQTLKAILDRKVQARDQPVLSYYLEIMKLCKRHDPNTTEKQIIQYVIQGLRPEYCERILNETCDTLEQLENGLRKIELQIKLKELNREKCMRAESVGTDTTHTDKHTEELNNIQAEIKNLTQIVSSLKLQQDSHQPRGHDLAQRNRSRGYYANTARPADYRQSYQPPSYNRGYQPPPGRRGDYQQDYREPWRPRGQGTSQPRFQGNTIRGRNNYNGQYVNQRNQGLFCSYCRKTNHKTEDCRYKMSAQKKGVTGQTAKYCSNCKMTNHDTANCYKTQKPRENTKND
jgi:hypothetical protein